MDRRLHHLRHDASNHAITAKTYTTEAARDADLAWAKAENLHKVVFITDTGTLHILTGFGPATWQSVGATNLAVTAGVGMTSGVDGAFGSSVERVGGLIKTTIVIDLTGLNSAAADDFIIGVVGTDPAHMGQITVARNGTIFMGTMRCLELPAGGDPNVSLWSAVEATGVENTDIDDLTEVLLLNSQTDGTDWIAGDEEIILTFPVADSYLYLTQGDATGTNATYTAGKFLIEFWGV